MSGSREIHSSVLTENFEAIEDVEVIAIQLVRDCSGGVNQWRLTDKNRERHFGSMI
jgi:hypothetical protein